MEVQPLHNHNNCFEIIPQAYDTNTNESKNAQPVLKKQYKENEIQNFSISKLKLWKGISLFNVSPSSLNFDIDDNQEEYNNESLLNIQQSNNEIILSSSQSKKNPKDTSIELASKAMYELTNLHLLSSMIFKSSNQLIKAYYRPSVNIPLDQNYTKSLLETIKLPISQRVLLKQEIFCKMREKLSKSILEMQRIVTNRQAIVSKLEVLGKHWKLISSLSHNTVGKGSFQKSVSVDCSFVNIGDAPVESNSLSDVFSDHLVSLSVNDEQDNLNANCNSTSKLSVNKAELNTVENTIEFQLYHRNFGKLATQTTWDLLQSQQSGVLYTDNTNELESHNLLDIHHYCIRRKHHALCCRLFQILNQQLYLQSAMSSNSSLKTDTRSAYRWLIKPSILNASDSSVGFEFDKVVDSLLGEEFTLNSNDIRLMERGQFVITLSSNLYIRIKLIPITSLVEGSQQVKSKFLGVNTMNESNIQRINGFEKVIQIGFLKMRVLLMHYFHSLAKQNLQILNRSNYNKSINVDGNGDINSSYHLTNANQLTMDRYCNELRLDSNSNKRFKTDSTMSVYSSILESYIRFVCTRIRQFSIDLRLESIINSPSYNGKFSYTTKFSLSRDDDLLLKSQGVALENDINSFHQMCQHFGEECVIEVTQSKIGGVIAEIVDQKIASIVVNHKGLFLHSSIKMSKVSDRTSLFFDKSSDLIDAIVKLVSQV